MAVRHVWPVPRGMLNSLQETIDAAHADIHGGDSGRAFKVVDYPDPRWTSSDAFGEVVLCQTFESLLHVLRNFISIHKSCSLKSNREASLGVVARNSDRNIIFSAAHTSANCLNSEKAELRSLKKGVDLAAPGVIVLLLYRL